MTDTFKCFQNNGKHYMSGRGFCLAMQTCPDKLAVYIDNITLFDLMSKMPMYNS